MTDTTTILLWTLLISFPALLHAQQCLSLSGSTACPAFRDYYVSVQDPSFVAKSWLANVNSVESFDAGLSEYVNSSSFWQSLPGCQQAKNETAVYYARYALSITCADLAFDMRTSLPCNFEMNVLPQALCQSSCLLFVKSVESILQAQKSLCQNSSETIDTLTQQCYESAALKGGISDCLSADLNEPGMCGFQNDSRSLCIFCQGNSQLSCCAQVHCSSELQPNTIAGIVTGSVCGVLVLLGAIFCWTRRRRQQGYAQPSRKDEDDPPKDWREPASDETNTTSRFVSKTSGISSMQSYLEGLCRAIYPNQPQHDDELAISTKDIIRMYYYFDDGWALGDNLMTGQRGFFPVLCVVRMPTDEILQVLSEAELHTLEEMSVPHAESEYSESPERSPIVSSAIPKLRRSTSTKASNTTRIDPLQTLPQRSVSMRASIFPHHYKPLRVIPDSTYVREI